MGSVTSGVGLISGIDIQSLVDKLMEIEARPVTLLQTRATQLTMQKTAFLTLNALILAAKSASKRFDEVGLFNRAVATSNDESILKATASEGALPGNYSFVVQSLASSHQVISQGYADADSALVGAGTITIESAAAKVAPETRLETLRGGAGVHRGSIRITDRSGTSVEVDLSAALTIGDVVDAINSQTSADVTASVSGGHLVLTDHTGLTAANLRVAEIGTGQMATDLGIVGSVAGDVLTGGDVAYITQDTSLSLLNDGNGIRRNHSMDDFQIELRDGSTMNINLSATLQNETKLSALNHGSGVRLGQIRVTNRNNQSAEIDLSSATTVGDVVQAIQGAGLGLSASTANGHLLITDSSGGTTKLAVQDVSGYAARDLGIAQQVEGASLKGAEVYQIDTVGDVIRAINLDDQNTGALTASLQSDGKGIRLVDTSTGAGQTIVTALNDSGAADDLGILGTSDNGMIESRDLIAGLQTVLLGSLNGGQGVQGGVIRVTARDGTVSSIDLSGLNTLSEVIDAINATSSTSKVSASVNSVGNGLVLNDTSGGTGHLVVADVDGTTAADLHIADDVIADRIDGDNLQRQYISENTRLDQLNGGTGITRGKFKITSSTGRSTIIDLTQGNETTLGDVIRKINMAEIGVTASINTTGDGLLLTDTASGASLLKVEEDSGGKTAADLNILGTAATGQTTLNGSFERSVEIGVDDTLNDVAAKLNAADADIQASVLNDGSVTNPYRLVVTSRRSGRQGEVLVDSGDVGLSLSTLTQARDSIVFLGQQGSANRVLLTSGSTTLNDAIPNVKIGLLATSRVPVDVTVSADVESLVTDIKTFVSTFNSVISKIEDLTSFNSETYVKGTLFGDSAVDRIQSRMYQMLRQPVSGAGIYRRLADVGLTLGSGAQLEFDESKFRSAIENHAEDVKTLFTKAEAGVGVVVDRELTALTTTSTGLIDRHTQNLENQGELLAKRIEQMQALNDAKRQRLLNQYYAMEEALAAMQSQQSTLSSLASLSSTSSKG